MPIIRYRPGPPLEACVECFWWSQREQPQPHRERMLPSGSAQLVITLHDAPIACRPGAMGASAMLWNRGILHGPQWSYYESGAKPVGAAVGVAFRPGAAGAILGVPLNVLADRHVTIDALWGARGEQLRQQLLALQTPAGVFRALERELTARLQRPLLLHPAVAHALSFQPTAWAASRVGDIQRAAGYSPRHFAALFRAAVGLTPKHYYRIKRFTAVVRHLAGANRDSLAALAASVGYSDQAHLTRESAEFAGMPPTRYQAMGSAGILHQQIVERAAPQDGSR